MKNLPSILTELKSQLEHSDDYRATYEYFLTNLGEVPEFQQTLKECEKPDLSAILTKTSQAMLGEARTIPAFVMLRTRNTSFFHGCTFLEDGTMIGFLYFSDLDQGLINIVVRGGEILQGRFSVKYRIRIDPPASPGGQE